MLRRSPLSLLAPTTLLWLIVLAAGPSHAAAPAATYPVPARGVIGIDEAHLGPRFWIERLPQPDVVLLGADAIAAQNERLLRLDDSMHDLRSMPQVLTRAQVVGWISALSQRPRQRRFDTSGVAIPEATLDGLADDLALDGIHAQQPTRFGLVVQRAALRTFPTNLRVFSKPGETDIDRFQETALFPGDPVVIAHRSRDGKWLFVISPRYAAWIQAQHVAEGTRAQVLGHGERTPFRVVTGAKERTVFTREQPGVSELQLEMGVRVPVMLDWPADEPVNGQHPYSAHVIQLPVRGDDGRLALVPALLPKIADSAGEYLPLTASNLITQSFKFLGERYGWGHAYNGRDCSGFVSEIYRSFGVQVPRNTSAQAVSPALDHTTFAEEAGGAARAEAVAGLQVGDLVYMPGHVVMVIGHVDGEPYVIHDINGGSYLGADGSLRNMQLNGVSVTPLLPMMLNERERYVDRMTSVVRMRAAAPAGDAVRTEH
ncbi:MAG TPA: SH3 domain-containing protein [Lysobacter sp.]|nr:SH3 domain-containing protein [Lysobacter sp.]